jgi:hypothetical protein
MIAAACTSRSRWIPLDWKDQSRLIADSEQIASVKRAGSRATLKVEAFSFIIIRAPSLLRRSEPSRNETRRIAIVYVFMHHSMRAPPPENRIPRNNLHKIASDNRRQEALSALIRTLYGSRDSPTHDVPFTADAGGSRLL